MGPSTLDRRVVRERENGEDKGGLANHRGGMECDCSLKLFIAGIRHARLPV